MTSFVEFWDISTFREAFLELIRLSDDARQAFREALGDGSIPTNPPEGVDLSSDAWSRARSTIRTLVAIRDEEGYADLINDISQVMRESPDSERAVQAIQSLLELDPETEQWNLVRRVQYNTLPVLVNMNVDVDFRVVAPIATDQPSLAPVYVVRLTFDESVSGSDAIVFQVPEDAVEIVLRRLQEANTMRAAIARMLPEPLLHPRIRERIMDNG